MTPQEFKKRYDAAQTNKQKNWETLYREAMELFCPERENFYNQASGQKKGRTVYTSSPYIAFDKAANNIHSSLTPHLKRWTNLKPGRMIPKDQKKEAAAQLEEIKDTLFDHIFTSNFDLAISEFYRDLMIGTAALMVTGTPKQPLIFTSVPLNELCFSTGALGVVDKIYRRYQIKVGVILDTWDDADMPNDLKIMAEADPEKKIWCIEGTTPKKFKAFDLKTEEEIEKEGFGYYVLLEKFADKFIVDRNMDVNPWIVARWSVMSGEEWGRGPVIVCLNDGKTLNQFIKLHMQSMEINTHPTYTVVDDGVINISAIRVGPGAMLPVSANDGVFGPSIKPLPTGGNLQAGQMEIERLEASINDQMYTEPLGSVNLPVKTATEISIRQQELAKRIGSAYGRLQYELINPLVNICLYQLDKLNIINMNDFKVDGHMIAIDAVSPLAQSQQQDEINNVVRFIEFALGSFGPEVGMGAIKADEAIDFIGDQLNVPERLMYSKAEKEQNKEVAEKQMAAQAMMAQQGQPSGK